MTRNDKLVNALTKARDVFQTYGDLHRSKTPPQLDKARANYMMVDEINKALVSEDDQPALDLVAGQVIR